MVLKINIKKLHPQQDADIPLPSYQTFAASGLDLQAAVKETLVLKTKDIVLIPTGLALAIPFGYEAQVRPRSGLALKKGLTLINSPGTIDSDYRGEIGLAVINLGTDDIIIKRGDRLAQLIFQKVEKVELILVENLEDTPRGEGGFGSTDL